MPAYTAAMGVYPPESGEWLFEGPASYLDDLTGRVRHTNPMRTLVCNLHLLAYNSTVEVPSPRAHRKPPIKSDSRTA